MNHFDSEHYIDDSETIVRPITPLVRHEPSKPEEPPPAFPADPESARRGKSGLLDDPGLKVLFPKGHHLLSPPEDNPDPDRSRSASASSDDQSEDTVRQNSAMSGQATVVHPTDVPAVHQPALQLDIGRPQAPANPGKVLNEPSSQIGSPETVSQRTRESSSRGREDSADLASRPRVDSARQSTTEMSPSKHAPQTPQHSPLKLETNSPSRAGPEVPPSASAESIQTSPRLSKHTIRVAEGAANTLPAVQKVSPTKSTTITSPQSLPPFSQLFPGQLHQSNEQNHLKELAEAATAAEARAPATSSSHHHSHSFGSTTSQSPILPYYPQSNISHTSPLAVNLTAKSPVSVIGDVPSYLSPQQQQQPYAYYDGRRRSSTVEHVAPFLPPVPNLPSMPSTSSSEESRGRAASSTDGYSTSQTTPVESGLPTDGSMRVASSLSGPFKCDDPGCNHAFQTQYLLSSHRNVHSQNRPHYCPVQDCPRGEGGRGFKRKNEMIRHGLVHSSPGYICPFCPDRNHRYPRPDNLQRHVRVHHVDKDKDDPALREVLSQRAEGTGKARRRRTQGSIGSSG